MYSGEGTLGMATDPFLKPLAQQRAVGRKASREEKRGRNEEPRVYMRGVTPKISVLADTSERRNHNRLINRQRQRGTGRVEVVDTKKLKNKTKDRRKKETERGGKSLIDSKWTRDARGPRRLEESRYQKIIVGMKENEKVVPELPFQKDRAGAVKRNRAQTRRTAIGGGATQPLAEKIKTRLEKTRVPSTGQRPMEKRVGQRKEEGKKDSSEGDSPRPQARTGKI